MHGCTNRCIASSPHLMTGPIYVEEAEPGDVLEIRLEAIKPSFPKLDAKRFVDEGTVISPGQPVLTLVENDALEAHVSVPVATGLQIPIGRIQQLQLKAKTYQAQVISTLPQVDSVTRTSTVILRLPAAATGEVRAGQITRLSLSKTISEPGYWLPTTALVKGIRGLWSCYVLGRSEVADGRGAFRIEQRELEVLHTQSDRVFVRGTLQQNDQVVINGNHRLVVDQLVYSLETQDFGSP